jgi:hypothetical protein
MMKYVKSNGKRTRLEREREGERNEEGEREREKERGREYVQFLPE